MLAASFEKTEALALSIGYGQWQGIFPSWVFCLTGSTIWMKALVAGRATKPGSDGVCSCWLHDGGGVPDLNCYKQDKNLPSLKVLLVQDQQFLHALVDTLIHNSASNTSAVFFLKDYLMAKEPKDPRGLPGTGDSARCTNVRAGYLT